MNKFFPADQRAARLPAHIALSLTLGVAAALVLAGCPKGPDDAAGGFGEAKPVKNDGMVTRPGPVDSGPPDWNSALQIVPAYDQANQQLLVVLKIKPGFHAYGPGEEVSKPVALRVDATNGWAVDGAVDVPAGKKKDLGELGTSVILEGDVPLRAKLKAGAGAISGVVEAQVCTDKACDRPKKHPFTIPG